MATTAVPVERAAPAGLLADVGIVGNGQIIARVRADGSALRSCGPRPDGDSVFFGLLDAVLTAREGM